jgi:WD40 repeat protein
LIASAQEGKNSIIRIWEYFSGRCISMVTMPVNQLKCLSFSHDGKYLATVGKDQHNREMVIVWDISKVQKGDKPEIVAK